MDPSPPRPARWVLVSWISIAAVVGIAVVGFINSRKPVLVSSPTAVRPWAEAEFLRLTKPVPSPDSPLHPQYLARHGGSLPPSDSNHKARVIIELPSIEFVPKYELLDFDAADGFASGTRSGKIRWMAAKPYDLPEDLDKPVDPSVLPVFHSDGNPMTVVDSEAAGITQRDREAWGLELNGETGTAMKWLLELDGFINLQWKFQQVFDASTHVPLVRLSSVTQAKAGLLFGAGLAVLHDAPLIAVIDLAHGETQAFDIPVSKGAKVSHADFQLEVIDVFEGTVSHGRTEPIRAGKAIDKQYGVNIRPGAPAAFSVIYQINPPAMATALSVDALDAAGKELKNLGRFMDHAPVSKFGAPLASATSLRVRYRPLQTRLLMKMKSVPGVTAPNLKPIDFFDVSAPKVGIMNSFQMRRIIADGAQLKDITGSWSYDTPTAFPMSLTNASPRQVADRYLALDSGRTIKLDPVAMTIEFEPPKKPSWLDATWEWLKKVI